jgi:hypothetical protein
VKEIWSRRVRVYQGFVDSTVLVEDLENGKRFPAEVFTPKLVGEFRGAPKTDLEQLLEEPLPVATSRPTWRPEQESNVVHLVRAGEVRESSFEMPEAPASSGATLEDVAQGVRVLERQETGATEEEIYATPADRYFALRVREIKGERLEPEEVEFMRHFEAVSREYRMLGEALEKRARMAAGE